MDFEALDDAEVPPRAWRSVWDTMRVLIDLLVNAVNKRPGNTKPSRNCCNDVSPV
eukprot:SAG11_NODE_27558_length_331_cov_0.892241_1_plen_54_part_10